MRTLTITALLFTLLAIFLGTQRQSFQRITAGPDGTTLRTLRSGHGTPTVVFESGAGSPLETWVRIQPAVSRFTSTFAYDRAGLGLSTKGATPRDGERIADELQAALVAAHASPPYVLVGHSLGGPFIRVFAGRYSNDVAGLVLVDPTQEDLLEWAKAHEPQSRKERPFRPHDEVDCAPLTFAQARELRLPNVPVVVISGIGPRKIPDFLPVKFQREVQHDREVLYPAKAKFHQRWVESLPEGKIVVTENSGHGIPWEEPELVVDVIRDVVARVRAGPSSKLRGDKP
jgi:pimeloyl-ACP methyl ester carboxylesterase